MNSSDPVCGMEVDPAKSVLRFDRGGTTYHFCSPHCLERFRADPEKYLTRREVPLVTLEPIPPPPAQGVHTCPMHPEIESPGPGSCPICGMALEPRVAAPAGEVDRELESMSLRLRICLILTVPLVLLAMGGHLFRFLPEGPKTWIELALATPVVLWGGWIFFVRAWESLKRRSPNMFTLIGIGTGTTYLYSLLAALAPGIFPGSLRGHGGAVGVYFESAAVITTLVLLGQVLEIRARRRTAGAIRALLDLSPKAARLLGDGGVERDVPLEWLKPGDRIRVRPGERVPVDGLVLEGGAAVDESMITGEPMPVEKSPGSKVTGGTLNRDGAFILKAERVGRETLLSQIIRMVGEAQRSRAPIQGLADRVSAHFVPAVFAVAVFAFALWVLFGPEPRLSHALASAIAVVMIACPCALGLATPVSIMVGMGRGATAGVLIKDAEALEVLEKVDAVVFDKTGTLTEGKARLEAVIPSPPWSERDLLFLAGSVERGSEHPLAKAIVDGARRRGISIEEPVSPSYLPGKGAAGTVGGRAVLVGSARILAELGVDPGDLVSRGEELQKKGKTVVLVAVDLRPAGILSFSDPLKPSTREAIESLHRSGVRLVMATGDGRATAEGVGRDLGIDEVRAEILPREKEKIVEELQAQGRTVAFAGDGVNDAPALARANVGIAMGTGTDVAMESALVTLVKGDLRGIARARALSRAVMANIRQNLVFAFAYNVLGIPIATGALYPAFGILLDPMIAAAAMTLSSVSVIANALRLRKAEI